MNNRYTWQEAERDEKERLGRQPTEKEIAAKYDYMNSG